MPIYEYECTKCSRKFEVIHRPGDRKKPPCPGCASRRVQRLISPAGFVLKGSGWYKTDYPSEARKKAMEAEGKGSPGAAAEKTESEAGPEKPEKAPKPEKAGKTLGAKEPRKEIKSE